MKPLTDIGYRSWSSTIGAGVTGVLLVVMAVLSCNRLVDSLRPFSRSSATVTGLVQDSLWGGPIGNATVQVGSDVATLTNDNGEFLFNDIVTGVTELIITAPGYDSLRCSLDVTLNPARNIYRLIRSGTPPAIESVQVDTAGRRFLDDPVTLTFSAHDSSGGIRSVLFSPGDGTTGVLEHRYETAVYFLVDSFTVTYVSPGSFTATLQMIGAQNDTATVHLHLDLQKPRRPVFTLLRPGTDGFNTGMPGYLQISIGDPDSIMTHLTLNWGDGSAVVQSTAHQGTYWHVYPDQQFVTIWVKMYGTAGILDSARLDYQVVTINPPLLDSKLFFKPCQYCAPHDSVILIGVRILAIKDNWAKQIIWVVNENDPPPAFAYHRDTLTVQTGAISDSIGNLFVHEFPTDGFKGTNMVEVRVVDALDNSSTVSGTFFIAGRGD